jgi:hypothetical protein
MRRQAAFHGGDKLDEGCLRFEIGKHFPLGGCVTLGFPPAGNSRTPLKLLGFR